MDLSHPLVDLVGENTARVIRRLALVNTGLSGRRIAELAQVPVASASRVLAKLDAVGLVHTEDVGPSRLYRLNRDHVLWNPLNAILRSPDIIREAIADVAAGADVSASVAVYGSFARGDAGPSSDIDLVIVNSAAAPEQPRIDLVDSLHERIRNLTGNSLEIIEIDDEHLARMAASDDPLLGSWSAEAQTLAGPDLTHRISRARLR